MLEGIVDVDETSRTIWDVPTNAGVTVTQPDRPSQALVSLPNGRAITVTVSPGALLERMPRCSRHLIDHYQAPTRIVMIR